MDNNLNNLTKRLESGIATKVLLLSHNSLWPYLQQFEKRYKNFKVDVFGSGTAYMRMRQKDMADDYDFIIFNSSNYFNEHELNVLKDTAFKISEVMKKRVSIGYLYLVPREKRKYEDISEEITIVSFNDCIEHEEITHNTEDTTLLDLTELVVASHEELQHQKIYKYISPNN